MSTKEPCDHMTGYKIIEDEDYGEEIYIPVYASDDEYLLIVHIVRRSFSQ